MAMNRASAITRVWFCAVFTGALMLLCSNQAQAQTKTVYPKGGHIEYIKVIPGGKQPGMEIKLTIAGIKYGATDHGSAELARTVVREAEKVSNACRAVKVYRLARQIQLHAIAYVLNIKRNHANPVNVTWDDIL